MTCEGYLGPFLASPANLGQLLNPNATSDCEYCRFSIGDAYLATLNMYWSQRWRNFAIFCVYVPFPRISKSADTLFSISSPSSSSSTLPAFERRRRNLLRQHPSAISWIPSRVSERQLKIMLFQRTLERTILAVWINLWPAPISQSGRVLVWRHSIHVVLEERGLDEMLIIRIKGGEFVLFWFYNCAICMRCWFY